MCIDCGLVHSLYYKVSDQVGTNTDKGINAYIPDNQFRSRDPKFANQKNKYKRPSRTKKDSKILISSKEFQFDPVKSNCVCPAGESINYRSTHQDEHGNNKTFFEGRLSQCKNCTLNTKCMRNPAAANHRKGKGVIQRAKLTP